MKSTKRLIVKHQRFGALLVEATCRLVKSTSAMWPKGLRLHRPGKVHKLLASRVVADLSLAGKAHSIILAPKEAGYQAWWLIADCGSCGPRDVFAGTDNQPGASAAAMPVLRWSGRLCCDGQQSAGLARPGGADLGAG